jgi:CheY-like chemotaxis protein/HPt (histidine-containing phosphotransfer) domain-containing protein
LLLSASMRPVPIRVRVLVVDDDEMSRELLQVLLEAEGYVVDAADSGESALAALRSSTQKPGIILTDMQMPGATGSALATELRAVTPPGTILLAMSGSQPPQDALTQFDSFLMKPFGVEQFAQAVERVHRQAQPRRGSGKVVSISSGVSEVSSANSGVPPAVADTEADQPPAVNTTIYEQLSRNLPAPQLQEMYALCINDARERIHRMRGSAQEHNQTHFVREAHAIKGSAGMLGATQIHTMASDLEVRGLDGPDGDLETVNSLDELSAACDRLERMLGTRA